MEVFLGTKWRTGRVILGVFHSEEKNELIIAEDRYPRAKETDFEAPHSANPPRFSSLLRKTVPRTRFADSEKKWGNHTSTEGDPCPGQFTAQIRRARTGISGQVAKWSETRKGFCRSGAARARPTTSLGTVAGRRVGARARRCKIDRVGIAMRDPDRSRRPAIDISGDRVAPGWACCQGENGDDATSISTDVEEALKAPRSTVHVDEIAKLELLSLMKPSEQRAPASLHRMRFSTGW